MKRIIFAAVSIAAITAAGSAFADDAQSTVARLSGSVPNVCVLTTPILITSNLVSAPFLNGNGGGSEIKLDALVDSGTAKLNSTSFTLQYADSYCNYAHDVSLQATNGGLIDQNVGSPNPISNTEAPFIRRIGYNSTIRWGAPAGAQGPSPSHSTTTDAGDSTHTAAIVHHILGAHRGVLELAVSIDPSSNNEPVVAGFYVETFTIKLGPTI